jgi:hypothetical protein
MITEDYNHLRSIFLSYIIALKNTRPLLMHIPGFLKFTRFVSIYCFKFTKIEAIKGCKFVEFVAIEG